MPGSLFCFGYGYTAAALARVLAPEGWRIAGSKRWRADPADSSAERGLLPFDADHPIEDAQAALAGVTHILISAPPEAAGDPVLRAHRKTIAALPELVWVGYLSTTGVYGDTGGTMVDEEAACNPTSDRSRYRVAAEEAWLALCREAGVPVHIFRLAGIYGPGRSALDNVRAGRARRIDLPGHLFSRIHVDDIATVLRASIARPNPGRTYNVCDNEPASGADVVAHACGLLGVAPPPLVRLDDAGLSPMARSFYNDNRLIDNRRIREELGVSLRYPTYREGLRAILDGLE